VPSSSSSPHRPQFDSVSKYPRTSSCVVIVLLLGGDSVADGGDADSS
jgi:hypothetical protein